MYAYLISQYVFYNGNKIVRWPNHWLITIANNGLPFWVFTFDPHQIYNFHNYKAAFTQTKMLVKKLEKKRYSRKPYLNHICIKT